MEKGLSRFDIFDAIQFQCVGHFTEDAFGDLQSFRREFVNLVFGLEITRDRDENRYDEPAEKRADNECAKVFPLR